ncbi:CLUMA_CG003448, isoform A [Clunio marinus]|uniref:CLUMA_CG003448, isoform A n=1 Tax=Clunio marinus TaxID=568069 RepID=A0A1J1HQB1_9DIPT|nr:CLUMA_CG003448, isoform A [Clunio marinus]
MKISVLFLLFLLTFATIVSCSPMPDPGPQSKAPKNGKGNKRIRKVARGPFDLFNRLLYKSLLIDEKHHYVLSHKYG